MPIFWMLYLLGTLLLFGYAVHSFRAALLSRRDYWIGIVLAALLALLAFEGPVTIPGLVASLPLMLVFASPPLIVTSRYAHYSRSAQPNLVAPLRTGVGALSPVVLAVAGILLAEHVSVWALMAGFVVVGFPTGLLWRSWWAVPYVAALFFLSLYFTGFLIVPAIVGACLGVLVARRSWYRPVLA